MPEVKITFRDNKSVYQVGEEMILDCEIVNDEPWPAEVKLLIFWQTRGRGANAKGGYCEEILHPSGNAIPARFSRSLKLKAPLHPVSFIGKYFTIFWTARLQAKSRWRTYKADTDFELSHFAQEWYVTDEQHVEAAEHRNEPRDATIYVYDDEGNVVKEI